MESYRSIDAPGVPARAVSEPEALILSVCIVTYQARDYLRDCLRSLFDNTRLDHLEVVVVDNGSHDQVGGMLAAEFPGVRLIENPENGGYTQPMNQLLRAAGGRYLLQLNPDTIILPGALDNLVGFLESRPEVGICGPKVLNRDLSLQKPCRRGEPRPLAVFSYFLGLDRLFPRNRRFGEYLLGYLDPDQIHPVAGVSGSCMLIRREVVDQIGYLDEQYFAYQEDADYCFRARQAGWEVYYVPTAQIIHYGGQGGSRVHPYRSIIAWHKSYWLFYRKHFSKDYFFLFNWFYYLAMFAKLAWALTANFLRREKFAGPRR
jgi:GT2 family glycosyltransferase